ncbi:hypothetical protein OSH04_00430 [Alcaligenes sp. A-TC2]|uniref:hypothetical protein n=1 Tax=Alcaligenes nematophilus TaxID=2994643 RepID=UPI002252EB8F|nr:hypothetical protein [Alcaligenes nematophilus]MCX5470170.1 hypothetical protein [Alcaligenes nematophilus]
MKYALKLARHGSVFLARVVWIGVVLAFDFILLLINSSDRKGWDNLAAPEVPDPFDRTHINWDLYYGWQESDQDEK